MTPSITRAVNSSCKSCFPIMLKIFCRNTSWKQSKKTPGPSNHHKPLCHATHRPHIATAIRQETFQVAYMKYTGCCNCVFSTFFLSVGLSTAEGKEGHVVEHNKMSFKTCLPFNCPKLGRSILLSHLVCNRACEKGQKDEQGISQQI